MYYKYAITINTKGIYMFDERRSKGSVWIRESAASVAFYKVVYGEKKKRLITLRFEEVGDKGSQLAVRKLFDTPEEAAKILQYFATFESRHKNRPVAKKAVLSKKQILDFMISTPEALSQMIEEDPKCENPSNQQLAYEIWKSWRPIRQLISNASGWNIKEADSKRELNWGTVDASAHD